MTFSRDYDFANKLVYLTAVPLRPSALLHSGKRLLPIYVKKFLDFLTVKQ